MEPELRDYQSYAISEIIKAFRAGHKRVLLCLPTGAGKTFLFSKVVKDVCLTHGKKAAVLAHRTELVGQAFGSFRQFGIGGVNIIAPGTRIQIDQVNIGMVETFFRRHKGNLNSLGLDMLVVDETHVGNFRKVIEGFKGLVLGVSATPVAASRNDPLNTYYDTIIVPIQIPDLIDMGYLARGITYSIDHDFKDLKKRAGEFTPKSLFEEFSKPKLFEGAIENYLRYCKGQRAMCFNVNVEHSNLTKLEFEHNGVYSEHVDGKTPQEERHNLIERYKDGGIPVLHNVGITTAGFDDPETTCIIQNFATMSLAKHFQTVGRGSRVFQDPINPFNDVNTFTIIDLGKNYLRHGIYGEKIDWEGIFHDPKKATNSDEDKRLIECEKCAAIIKINRPKCAHCGHQRTTAQINRALRMAQAPPDLKEIKKTLKATVPENLKGKRISSMTDLELMQFAKHMGYSKKWIFVQKGLKKKKQRKPKSPW